MTASALTADRSGWGFSVPATLCRDPPVTYCLSCLAPILQKKWAGFVTNRKNNERTRSIHTCVANGAILANAQWLSAVYAAQTANIVHWSVTKASSAAFWKYPPFENQSPNCAFRVRFHTCPGSQGTVGLNSKAL